MPFVQDHMTCGERYAAELANDLARAGIPVVKSGASRRWGVDVDRLVAKHGEQAVKHVVRWLATRHKAPFVPVVRSGRALREKWDRLFQMSGANFLGCEPGVDALNVCDFYPLSWPRSFEPEGEPAWVQHALQGVEKWLSSLELQEWCKYGPAFDLVVRWRSRVNAIAWGVDQEPECVDTETFADYAWADDDMWWQDVTNQLRTYPKNRR